MVKAKQDLCFQCGKPRVTTRTYTEYFKDSLVTITENVCSDPDCQKRTESLIEKEVSRKKESEANKKAFGRPKNKKNKESEDRYQRM